MRHGCTVIGLGGRKRPPFLECLGECYVAGKIISTPSSSSTQTPADSATSRSSSKLSAMSSRNNSKASLATTSRSSSQASLALSSRNSSKLSCVDSCDDLLLNTGDICKASSRRSHSTGACLLEKRSSSVCQGALEDSADEDPGLQLRLIAALAGVRQGKPLSCKFGFGDIRGLQLTASGDFERPSASKSEATCRRQKLPPAWLAAASLARRRRTAAEKLRAENRQIWESGNL